MIKIYSVSDKYIAFLRQEKRLFNVYDNKEDRRSHTRKYIGFVFQINEYKYFIPLSSPKKTDYIEHSGISMIRKNVPTVWRITNRKGILIGTIRFCGMIPVPESELVLYGLDSEQDAAYKDLIENEISFIAKHQKNIIKNAKFLYLQKRNEGKMLAKGIPTPRYMAGAVDYRLAEQKYIEFVSLQRADLY